MRQNYLKKWRRKSAVLAGRPLPATPYLAFQIESLRRPALPPPRKSASAATLSPLSPVHARVPKALEISNYSAANESGPKQSQAVTQLEDPQKSAGPGLSSGFLAKGQGFRRYFSQKHTEANVSLERAPELPRSLTRPRSLGGKQKGLNRDLMAAMQKATASVEPTTTQNEMVNKSVNASTTSSAPGSPHNPVRERPSLRLRVRTITQKKEVNISESVTQRIKQEATIGKFSVNEDEDQEDEDLLQICYDKKYKSPRDPPTQKVVLPPPSSPPAPGAAVPESHPASSRPPELKSLYHLTEAPQAPVEYPADQKYVRELEQIGQIPTEPSHTPPLYLSDQRLEELKKMVRQEMEAVAPPSPPKTKIRTMKELRHIHTNNPLLSKTAVRRSLGQVESHHDFLCSGVLVTSPKAHLLPRMPTFQNKKKQAKPALLLYGSQYSKERRIQKGQEFQKCFEETEAPFTPSKIVYNFETIVHPSSKKVDFKNKVINQGLRTGKLSLAIKNKCTSPMGSRATSSRTPKEEGADAASSSTARHHNHHHELPPAIRQSISETSLAALICPGIRDASFDGSDQQPTPKPQTYLEQLQEESTAKKMERLAQHISWAGEVAESGAIPEEGQSDNLYVTEVPPEHEEEVPVSKLIKIVNQNQNDGGGGAGSKKGATPIDLEAQRTEDTTDRSPRNVGKIQAKIERTGVMSSEDLMDLIAWKHNVFPQMMSQPLLSKRAEEGGGGIGVGVGGGSRDMLSSGRWRLLQMQMMQLPEDMLPAPQVQPNTQRIQRMEQEFRSQPGGLNAKKARRCLRGLWDCYASEHSPPSGKRRAGC